MLSEVLLSDQLLQIFIEYDITKLMKSMQKSLVL